MRTNLASILAASTLLAAARGQTVIRTFTGQQDNFVGHALEQAFDWNGDGYFDPVVGSPGGNGNRGGIYIANGRYIATGQQPNTLAALFPISGFPANAYFGWSIARAGDLTGDGVVDFLVGAPGLAVAGVPDSGAVFLVNGATFQLYSQVFGSGGERFGSTIELVGDINGDLVPDCLIGAPNNDHNNTDAGAAYVASGSKIAQSALSTFALHTFYGIQTGEHFGAALATGDFDLDGKSDLVIGSPDADWTLFGANDVDVGWVRIYAGSGWSQLWWGVGPDADEHFGASLDVTYTDNDNTPDLVIGSPGHDGPLWTNVGCAVVDSGARIMSSTTPYEIFEWNGGWPGQQLGACVSTANDINRDGYPDIMVGAPGYEPLFSGDDSGAVYLYSGETGLLLASHVGNPDERLGDAFSRFSGDYNGDGFVDFIVAGAYADTSASDTGIVKVISMFPTAPATYCTAKTNSLGCTPAMSWTGTPDVSSPFAFNLRATNVLNNKNGLLFYGFAPNTTSFQGGYLCVKQPVVRTYSQSSGGNAQPANDCSGSYSYDFNARIDSGADAMLVAGQEMFAQYWTRDPASASTTGLTNAVRFVINP